MTLLTQATGLLQDLHTKVTADAAAEVDAFKAYSSRCKEQAQDDGHQETPMANVATTKDSSEKLKVINTATSLEFGKACE